MSDVNFYLPIAKIDREQRMVFGYASTPTRDLDGEVIELDAIKAALPEYMTWANVREMHQPSAVGVAKEANVDEKGLYIGAKIVDDDAWKKVIEDVYKGFSIGGNVTDRKGATITGLDLIEISLVDRPANPDCKIDVKKAAAMADEPIINSAIEHGIVLGRDEVGLFGRLLAKLAGKPTAAVEKAGKEPYGDVEYADPGYQKDGKKRYPIDTEAHIRAAWSYIHQEKNAAKYSPEHAASIKRRIVAAWKSKIDAKGPPEASEKTAVPDGYDEESGLDKRDAQPQDGHGSKPVDADDEMEVPAFGREPAEPGPSIPAGHDGFSLPAKCDAATVEAITRAVIATLSKSGAIQMAEADLSKRAATGRHHDHIRKAMHHLVEAHKCAGAAMECLARGKGGEFKAADGTIVKAADHFARAMDHLERAHEHHVLAHHHLGQAMGGGSAAGHKGEPGEEPGDAEDGIYQPEPGLKPMAQRELTEGDVPEYDVDRPYRHGPVGRAEPAGMKAVQAELMKKAEEAAYLRGKVEAMEKMPANPKARLFAVPRGSLNVGADDEPDATEKLLKGVNLDAATPGARQAAAGKLISNMIANSATFGRPVLTDPSFRGGAAR